MDIIYKALFSIAGVAITSLVIHIIIHALIHRSIDSKPLAQIIGLIVASFGAFLILTFYNELRGIPERPAAMSIDKIVEEMTVKYQLWVTVTDGRWDCGNMAYTGKDSFAVLANQTETVLVVAVFDSKITCEELLKEKQPSGSLSQFEKRVLIYTSNYIDLSRYGTNTTFLSLCTYCGRSNSQLGIVMGTVFLVIGLLYGKVTIHPPQNRTNTTRYLLQPKDLTN